jgi:hypothetical protein
MKRLDVIALEGSMACGADWDELEDWEKECVAQHVEEL